MRRVEWRGVDDPSRRDAALVRVDAVTVEYWKDDAPRAVTVLKTVGALLTGGTPTVPPSKIIGL